MSIRYGLQAKFLVMMAAGLAVVLALIALTIDRQDRMQGQVDAIARESMQSMVGDTLRRRGEGAVVQLADTLANPLYYFDLDTIGTFARATLRQPGTRYVTVYDPDGNVLHDGSEDIADYGVRMADPLAYEVIVARSLHVQYNDETMDISAPIMIGVERLGGVRVGYDLDAVRTSQEQALGTLRTRLSEIGNRHLKWIAALGLMSLALGGWMLWLVQRWLVRPIRELADAAHVIESGQYDANLPETPRNDEVGDLVRAFSRMNASFARHDRDIRRMAYTDALTGLSNRLAFREALDLRVLQLHGAGRQLALLFADVDDFKRINDTLGHDAGDEVLLHFANRIRTAVELIGGDDAMLARFGGDEFVILVQGDDVRSTATRLADAVVDELAQPIVVHERQVFLGASIGITLFPLDAQGATALMKNGDIAMYQAKVAGKNCYRFYSRAMDEAVERRVHLEHELRGAWERGEMSVVYQPVFRMADHALVGAEALLRWRHPQQGVIAPAVFIDVAEQSGLIEALGLRVLRTACEDAVRWPLTRSGTPVFISVNVSPRQLRTGDLPQAVADILRETGLAPQRLHIELTETAVISDEAHASALLSRLRTSGVKVWLDDFGTGFSGLSHLRRVPVDGVKIDRSFVADILRDPDDLALTTAIIAMARSLSITVVAEGVEKEGQYNLLRERECDLAQGFWLGHPMGTDTFADLLR